MVRLSKIYTKTGDDGTTGLGNGSRVEKTDLRVEAYGTVDEANSFVGAAVLEAQRAGSAGGLAAALTSVQNDLFDVGADLCCPVEAGEAPGSRLRVTSAQTDRLERLIDEHNAALKPLDSFILPGGTPLSVAMHLARTAVRRAERRTVALSLAHAESINPETVRYLNRLSDLLFVLGRVANDGGALDVKWVPGASRGA